MELLAKVGLFDTSREQYWMESFALLQEFISENGRLPKERETYRGRSLGKWCKFQKARAGRGELSEARRQLLQETGLISAGLQKTWEDQFMLFSAFVEEHGRLPETKEVYHGVAIGKWYKRQREATETGAAAQERQQKMQGVVCRVLQ